MSVPPRFKKEPEITENCFLKTLVLKKKKKKKDTGPVRRKRKTKKD